MTNAMIRLRFVGGSMDGLERDVPTDSGDFPTISFDRSDVETEKPIAVYRVRLPLPTKAGEVALADWVDDQRRPITAR